MYDIPMSHNQGRAPNDTRRKLLEAAFAEIYENGFQGASLDVILENTNVTKGALYHYFSGKKELGLAVVDEIIKGHLERLWLVPLKNETDPLKALGAILDHYLDMVGQDGPIYGCPVNNLMQEMSPLDKDFRLRLQKLFTDWHEAISHALADGRRHGFVSMETQSDGAAMFIIASFFGSIGIAKNQRSKKVFQEALGQLQHYLMTLQPAPARRRNR